MNEEMTLCHHWQWVILPGMGHCFEFRFVLLLLRPRVTSMSVCLSDRIHTAYRSPVFACCLWPWLGLPLAALRYVTRTSGFVDDVIFHSVALWRVICSPKRR